MRSQRHILPLLLIGAISLPVLAQREHKGGGGFAQQPRAQQGHRDNQNQQPNSPPANAPNNQQNNLRNNGAAQAEPPLHGPGPHNGDWLRRFGSMPAQDQRQQLQSDPTFQRLPKERQQKLIQRLDSFNRMSPDQKERVLNRMKMLEHMTPEQRDRTRQMFQQFRQFNPDSRQRVTGALRRLHSMPPQARQNFYNSDAFRNNFSPQEQNVIKGLGELGPVDAEPPESPDR